LLFILKYNLNTIKKEMNRAMNNLEVFFLFF